LDVDPRTIDLSGWNARRENLEPDEDLVRSIGLHGILEPVGVRVVEKKRSELLRCVYGFRRTKAAIVAGLATIPVVLVDFDEEEISYKTANLSENYHRSNLRPWELAQALLEMELETGLEPAELGERVGMSPEYATQLVRVRKRLAPLLWEQFQRWGVSAKIPWKDLIELSSHPWETQVEKWNEAHDLYQGARRGHEFKPGPSKLRKMLKRIEADPSVMREGLSFAAGAKYALRVALGSEPWRHGGVATSRQRREREKARKAKAKGYGNGITEKS
jgi:ParB/RepB/Spo0J family partition protein